MSDTISDLASRAQAREEVAQFFRVHWWDDDTSTCDCGSPFVHSEHLAEVLTSPEVFARLAGLLGYVKADETPFLPSHLFAAWYATGERGSSSEAIAYRLTSGSVTGSYPCDPSDFRRCEKLLRAVPIARTRLDLVATMSPIWGRLVGAWDELVALGEDEVPGVFSGPATGSAPRMYARMKELISGEVE